MSIESYTLKNSYHGVPAGTRVWLFTSYDYGLSNDDTRVTGRPHICVTLHDQSEDIYPFMTCPVDLLEPYKE